MKAKRILALLLGLLIPAVLLPASALAEAATGLCPHHPEHTAECGYEAVEGSPCTHEHNEACGYAEEVPCSKGCADTAADSIIVHAQDCAYTAASPCTHVHDSSCGYVPLRIVTPCAYVCALCPTGSGSEEPSEEPDPDNPAGDEDGEATEVTAADTAWAGGRYLAGGAITIEGRVAVSGDVTLVLAEGAALTVSGGIQVPEGSSLIICSKDGSGSLIAIGSDGAAGIGGDAGQACGSVTIYSGSVSATGGAGAPGIGNGSGCEGGSAVVTIAGGFVTAAGQGVSSIGGGSGTVIVSGGLVNANFGSDWAFSTGESGSAVIFGSIGDQSQKESWNAIVFDGSAGQVYGQVTPGVSFTIPEGATLSVPEGAALTIPPSVTVTNNGRLLISGAYTGASSAPGREYYRVVCSPAENGTALISANGMTAAAAYAVAGARVTVRLTPAAGYELASVSAVCGGSALTTGQAAEGVSFIMPAGSVTVSAVFRSASGPVTPVDPPTNTDKPIVEPPAPSGKPGPSVNQSQSSGQSGANAPAYTVTIPANVSLGEEVTIRAEGVDIGASQALTVSLGKSENNFRVVSGQGAALRYSVKNDSGANLEAGSTVLNLEDGESGRAALAFSEPLDTPIYAGSYTDTLTFAIAVK